MPAHKKRKFKEKRTKTSLKDTEDKREHRKSRLSGVSMKMAAPTLLGKRYHVLTRSKSKLLNVLDSSDEIVVPTKVNRNHTEKGKNKDSPNKCIVQNIETNVSKDDICEISSNELTKETEVKSNICLTEEPMLEEISISVYQKPSSTSSAQMLATCVSSNNSMKLKEENSPQSTLHEKNNDTVTSSVKTSPGESNFKYLKETVDVNYVELDETNSERFEIAIGSKQIEKCSEIERSSPTVENNVNEYVKHELWKKTELFSLQRDIVRMERQKLHTFKRIFNNLYRTFFSKK